MTRTRMNIKPGDKIRHAYWNGTSVIIHDTPAQTVDRIDDNGKIRTTCGSVFSGACCVRVDDTTDIEVESATTELIAIGPAHPDFIE